MITSCNAWQYNSIFLIILSLSFCSPGLAFVGLGTTITVPEKNICYEYLSTQLRAAEPSELFKGGLLADKYSQERAAELASLKVRSVSDLGWKEKEARRKSNIRPKLWPFGGINELAIQDKANYSYENPNCPDTWLGLEDFYSLVKDDTAAADLIFVALAGGRAFVERNVAENVLDRWWGTSGAVKSKQKQKFDRLAFEQSVKAGQRDFVVSWALFLSLMGFAVTGIVFPTNPLELALVDILDTFL